MLKIKQANYIHVQNLTRATVAATQLSEMHKVAELETEINAANAAIQKLLKKINAGYEITDDR